MKRYNELLLTLQKASDKILFEVRQECINLEVLSSGATIGPKGVEIAKRVRRLMQGAAALDVCIQQINKIIKAGEETSAKAVDGEKTPDNSIAGAV